MKIGDEVYVHGYVDEIRNDVIIIRNDGGYFGTVPSEVAKYVKPHIYGKHADHIVIDEPQYDAEEVAKDINRRVDMVKKEWNARHIDDDPQTDCLTCRYNSDEWDSPKCDGCSKAHSNYEPQTDCAWK